MFKNRSFNVKMVKDEPAVKYVGRDGSSEVITHAITAEQMTELITLAGATAVKAYTAIKVVKTISSLAEIVAKSVFK